MNEQPTRRGFIDLIIALGSAVTGLALIVPSLMYLWPAARGGGAERVEVEGAQSLAPGQARIMQVGSLAVIVVRKRSGFEAYSASCTHLGCLVKWNAAKKQFLCPCHAAIFDENGSVVAGPPPAPLPRLQVKEVGEKVFVMST